MLFARFIETEHIVLSSTSSFYRFSLAALVLMLLVSLAPLSATAQRGEPQPMWLADAQLEGVSRETAGGYDFFVSGSLTVTSTSGPVSDVLVQVVLTGPAGEQIHTEAVTDRDGIATIVTSVPGPGDYGATLYDMHASGYYYDPRQDHLDIPAFILNPPNGVAAFVENGQVDQVRWFKPGGFSSNAALLTSWNATGLDGSLAAAIAVDQAGYVYTGSLYEAWGICTVDKFTWYGTPVSGYQTKVVACPVGGLTRIALATNLYNELIVGRNGPGMTIAVDRYNAGGSLLAAWDVGIPCDSQHLCFRALQDVAVDAQGRVYMTVQAGNIYTAEHQGVKVTSNTGLPLFEIIDVGSKEHQFLEPQGIDIDAAGNIFIEEPRRGRVKHLTAGAAGLTISDVWPTQFEPSYGRHAFAVDENGNVYVGGDSELHVYAGAGGLPPGTLLGGITQQLTPEYGNVVSVDVTP